MTRRTATMIVPSWIELTMVVREEMTPPVASYGDGEDDVDLVAEAPAQTVEVIAKTKVRREFVRYFFGRRDAQPGSELHFTNGHVMVVQEGLEAVCALLPGFVEVHSSGAPSAVMINPELVRFFHAHVPPLGSSGSAAEGCRLTFPNGNKLEVTDSYDTLNVKFGVN